MVNIVSLIIFPLIIISKTYYDNKEQLLVSQLRFLAVTEIKILGMIMSFCRGVFLLGWLIIVYGILKSEK